MPVTVYQCCYTNATETVGGVTTSGWKAVAVSAGIPNDAYENCVRLQVARSSIQGAMVDEANQVLNLLEFESDDSFAYVLRSQYGLRDSMGRANMFSQAFVMPWDENVLSNPWAVLGIADDNFHYNTEEAVGANERLNMLPAPELGQALDVAGIDSAAYIDLMHAVLARLLEKSCFDPLYVQYDGSAQQMRAVLMCIYSGLPLHMRKMLTSVSCPTSTDESKKLVFATDAKAKTCFAIPATGENNIVTRRMLGRIARAGYMDYLPLHLEDEGIGHYYESLAELAAELGDQSASNANVLHVAYKILAGTDFSAQEDDEIRNDVADALIVDWHGSERMEDHATMLLCLATKRGIKLTDASERDLNIRVANARTDAFRDAAEGYVIIRFSRMPEDEAAARLGQMGRDSFSRYQSRLLQNDRGRKILDIYYADQARIAEPGGWDALREVSHDSRVLEECPKTRDALDAAASDLYNSSLSSAPAASAAYDEYIAFMRDAFGSNDLLSVEQGAKETFWEGMTLSKYDSRYREDYDHLYVDCSIANAVIGLDDALLVLDEDEDAFLRGVREWILSLETALHNEAMGVLRRQMDDRLGIAEDGLNEWLEVVLRAANENELNKALGLRRALKLNDIQLVWEELSDFSTGETTSRNPDFDNAIVAAAMPMLMQMDESEPVGLDVWLSLGNLLDSRQPFSVFDRVNPAILWESAAAVVAGSKLLAVSGKQTRREQHAVQSVRNAGIEYIRGRGTQYKVVRQWLKEAERAEKRNRQDAGAPERGMFTNAMGPRDSFQRAKDLRDSSQAPSHAATPCQDGREDGYEREGYPSQGERGRGVSVAGQRPIEDVPYVDELQGNGLRGDGLNNQRLTQDRSRSWPNDGLGHNAAADETDITAIPADLPAAAAYSSKASEPQTGSRTRSEETFDGQQKAKQKKSNKGRGLFGLFGRK